MDWEAGNYRGKETHFKKVGNAGLREVDVGVG